MTAFAIKVMFYSSSVLQQRKLWQVMCFGEILTNLRSFNGFLKLTAPTLKFDEWECKRSEQWLKIKKRPDFFSAPFPKLEAENTHTRELQIVEEWTNKNTIKSPLQWVTGPECHGHEGRIQAGPPCGSWGPGDGEPQDFYYLKFVHNPDLWMSFSSHKKGVNCDKMYINFHQNLQHLR